MSISAGADLVAATGTSPEPTAAQPVDFMSRVLAWPGSEGPGYCNLHWTVPPSRGHGVRGRPYKDVHAFMDDAQRMAADPAMYKEIYYCLSTQAEHGGTTTAGRLKARRHASKALLLKAIWIDIDCGQGKDYPTQAEAAKALRGFLAQTDMPVPSATVNSGGGLHAYWISDKPLTVEQWRPYAEGLKSLVIQHKLCKDAGLIADAARILRVPGTFNQKIDGKPRPVELLHLLPTDYDFATPALARLATLVTVTPKSVTVAVTGPTAFTLPPEFAAGPAKAFAVLDQSQRLEAGIQRRDLSLPLLIDQAIVNCQHFRDCATTHGANHGQGLWALTLLACTFFDKGDRWAHYFSKGYPTYDAAETQSKYEEKLRYKAANNLGWPSCTAFEAEGAKCQGCPAYGRINSPLSLAERVQPMQAQPEERSFVDPYADFVGPAFPVDVLPPTLAEFVRAEHQAMGVDPSALAMATITAIAGAMHAETKVRVGDSWYERPIIWSFLIGHPSTMKSPTIEKAVNPLRSIDARRQKQWQQQHQLWKQIPKGGPKSPSPPEPPRPARCIISDITAEKAAEILSRDPSGALLVHDELAGWMDGFERYNTGAASRAFFLQCWNGGQHNKDRVGKGKTDDGAEIYIENVALSVLGGIQPDRLKEMDNLTSDGLLQRGLPVLMRPAHRGDENFRVTATETKYEHLVMAVHDAKAEQYVFDDEARVVLGEMLDYLHRLEQIDGFSPALIGAIGKLKGYFARLCLVLTVARKHDPDALVRATLPAAFTPEAAERLKTIFGDGWGTNSLADGLQVRNAITVETAEAAQKIIREFLLPHIFGLYDFMGGSKEHGTLLAIANFILPSNRERLRPSDFTEGVRALRGMPPRELRDWIGRFCALGWLSPEDERSPVPKAWLVEPGLREHFAERRRQAQVARTEAHAILRAAGSRAAPSAA